MKICWLGHASFLITSEEQGIRIVVTEVPSIDVIDVAVAIVIDTVAGNLLRIAPHVAIQRGDRPVDP